MVSKKSKEKEEWQEGAIDELCQTLLGVGGKGDEHWEPTVD